MPNRSGCPGMWEIFPFRTHERMVDTDFLFIIANSFVVHVRMMSSLTGLETLLERFV